MKPSIRARAVKLGCSGAGRRSLFDAKRATRSPLRMGRAGIAYALTSILLWSGPVEAQSRKTIPDRQDCPTCRIRLASEVVLVAPDSLRGFDAHTFMVAAGNNGYLIGNRARLDQILSFDSLGNLKRTIGRSGDGPGEFRWLTALAVGLGDTIHAFGTHHSVFTEKGEFVRSRYVLDGSTVNAAFGLPDNTLLLQAMFRTPELVGQPLHVVDTFGRRDESFGSLPGEAFTGEYHERFRAVNPSRRGGFWSMNRNHYQIAHWNRSGNLDGVLLRECEWCASWQSLPGPASQYRPVTSFASIVEDDAGRIWTLSLTADEQWAPVPSLRVGRESRRQPVAHDDRLWDSVLEVIDPGAARLVLSQRFDARYSGLLPGNRVWRLEETDGEVSIRVLRMAIQRQ